MVNCKKCMPPNVWLIALTHFFEVNQRPHKVLLPFRKLPPCNCSTIYTIKQCTQAYQWSISTVLPHAICIKIMRQMFFCNLCFFFICIPCYVAFNCVNILWSSKPSDRAVCGITWVFLLFLMQVYSKSFERQSSVKAFSPSFLLPADALSRSI